MYPSVSQFSGGQLRGLTDMFNIVVDVKNCTSDHITVKETNRDNTKPKTNNSLQNQSLCDIGKKNPDGTCKSEDKDCGECYCKMRKKVKDGVDVLYLEKCVCNKQIRTEESCTCGDMKVATWGSMLPVYSAKTHLIYKNPVCAACNGVTDGIAWTPVIFCYYSNFKYIDFELERFETCIVNFIGPKVIETSVLPRCVKKNHVCYDKNFEVPHDLNMTVVQVIDACESDFNSLYDKKERNVFCAICNGFYTDTEFTCFDTDMKAGSNSISLIMTLDFLMEKTGYKANLVKRKMPLACSSSVNILF